MPLSHHLNSSSNGQSPRVTMPSLNIMNMSISSSTVIQTNNKVASPSTPNKGRSQSNSSQQALAKQPKLVSTESSSVITTPNKVSVTTAVSLSASHHPTTSHSGKANPIAQQQQQQLHSGNGETDSGRASMASNVDQDQCSPLFQQRAFILNKCETIIFLFLIYNFSIRFFSIHGLTN